MVLLSGRAGDKLNCPIDEERGERTWAGCAHVDVDVDVDVVGTGECRVHACPTFEAAGKSRLKLHGRQAACGHSGRCRIG